jgi:hypothetical protein
LPCRRCPVHQLAVAPDQLFNVIFVAIHSSANADPCCIGSARL